MATVENSKSDDLKKEITRSLKNGGNIMPSIAEMLIKKGREEGREEGETKIIEKMIQKDMSDADIRIITGMSLSKIVAIRKRLKG